MSTGKFSKALSTAQWIGVTIALLVSLVFFFVGLGTVESIIVGILIATLTQVVELQMRIDQALPIAGLLRCAQQITTPIEDLLESYIQIRADNFRPFQEEAEGSLRHCRDKLSEMANEHMLTTKPRPEDPYGPSLRAVKEARKSIKAVDCGDLSHWQSPAANKYIAAHKRAITDNGTIIERVFVESLPNLKKYKPIIERQQAMGIKVFPVCERDAPSQLVGDYLIMDEAACIWVELNPDGTPRERRTTIDSHKVAEKLSRFAQLKEYTLDISKL